MNKSSYNRFRMLIGFLFGIGVWVFLYWLAGGDVPNERGAVALFYVVEMLGFGIVGLFSAQIAE